MKHLSYRILGEPTITLYCSKRIVFWHVIEDVSSVKEICRRWYPKVRAQEQESRTTECSHRYVLLDLEAPGVALTIWLELWTTFAQASRSWNSIAIISSFLLNRSPMVVHLRHSRKILAIKRRYDPEQYVIELHNYHALIDSKDIKPLTKQNSCILWQRPRILHCRWDLSSDDPLLGWLQRVENQADPKWRGRVCYLIWITDSVSQLDGAAQLFEKRHSLLYTRLNTLPLYPKRGAYSK